MSLPKTTPCTVVTVFSVETAEPVFDVMLYGVSVGDVAVAAVPRERDVRQWIEDGREGRRPLCGAEYVRQALRRRGLDPDDFASSVFTIGDVDDERSYLPGRD
jgi:hypothetical protein